MSSGQGDGLMLFSSLLAPPLAAIRTCDAGQLAEQHGAGGEDRQGNPIGWASPEMTDARMFAPVSLLSDVATIMRQQPARSAVPYPKS